EGPRRRPSDVPPISPQPWWNAGYARPWRCGVTRWKEACKMSHPGTSIPSELLALYLTGEADAAQRRAVEEWAAASPDNAAELESMRRVWELGADAGSMPEVDVDAAWERLDQRSVEEEGRGRVRAIRPVLTRWLAAAAMLTGLAFGARWFFQPRTDMYMAHATPTEVRLADSSHTVLSPGSRMEVRMGRKRR